MLPGFVPVLQEVWKGQRRCSLATKWGCRAAEQGSHSGNGEPVKLCRVGLAGVLGLFELLPLQVFGEDWRESLEAR